MSAFEFCPIAGDELDSFHRAHLSRDFPPNELKPLPVLRELMEQDINSVWAVKQNGAMAAYYILARRKGSPLVLLDYLAVEPELRGSGLGSAVLRELSKQLTKEEYLLLESEWPPSGATEAEQAIRQRRIRFYQRCGAELSPLRSLLFGVDYALLTLGGNPGPAEVEKEYLALYREMVPERWYRENLSVFRV
jgi:GNAT superfamily N-acetyltransferase